jgi:zinc/manganese transport system substrate-binding protein
MLAGIATALLLLVSPLAPVTAAQDDDPLRVVATFSVLADIVEQVGGERVEVTSLVPVGGDAHTFDPAPDQVMAIAEADLIVEVGGDFEPWLDDLVEASGSDATRFEAFGAAIDHDPSEHEAGAGHDDHEATAEDHAGDDHDHGDEIHLWLDVENTIHAVTHLVETLAELDPDHADAYAKSGDAYTAALEEMDAYIVAQVETIPEDRRHLITTHQSLGAFADAYGFEIPGVLLESHTTEGADAPAGHVAELVGIIEERGIPAVFPDTPGGEDQLAPLAEAAGVEIAPALYVDTLGDAGSGAETYIEMMRHNIDVIVAALAS